MALKKKDDSGFEAIKLEAEEAGINLTRGADGTFSAFIVGGASLDEYPNARELLDDMLAVQEMDEKDDLYAYDNGPMGGYQVAVTGNPKPFESPTLAGALAMAKESLIPKPVAKATPKVVESKKTLNPTQPIMAQIDTDGGLIEDEAEILSPTKPNGAEAAQMRKDDLAETLAQGYLDLASLLTTFATTLRASPSTIPFVQKGFAEGEPAEETEAPQPARSRITRERRGK